MKGVFLALLPCAVAVKQMRAGLDRTAHTHVWWFSDTAPDGGRQWPHSYGQLVSPVLQSWSLGHKSCLWVPTLSGCPLMAPQQLMIHS